MVFKMEKKIQQTNASNVKHSDKLYFFLFLKNLYGSCASTILEVWISSYSLFKKPLRPANMLNYWYCSRFFGRKWHPTGLFDYFFNAWKLTNLFGLCLDKNFVKPQKISFQMENISNIHLYDFIFFKSLKLL